MSTSAPCVAGLVLAVHPTSRGFGWVLFEGPDRPALWGIASVRKGRHGRLLRRFERLLGRYEPAVFVLEEFEAGSARRSERIQDLCREMQHRATAQGIFTPVYHRDLIRACFAGSGASTRYEIAQAIAKRIPNFDHRMPRYRKAWLAEDARQSLFDAAALALTYFAVMGES